jgi:hypothetical protein
MNGYIRHGESNWLRTVASYLAGIGIETLYTLCLAGIGALIILGLRLLAR